MKIHSNMNSLKDKNKNIKHKVKSIDKKFQKDIKTIIELTMKTK